MTMTELERADWLAWRRHGIGSADVGGIHGLSPWSSPFSVWAEKVGLHVGPEENEMMEAGRWLELAIGPWFAHRTGLYISGEQTPRTHPDEPWMRCTLDALVYDYPGAHLPAEEHEPRALGPLEIKTAGWQEWKTIPEHYQAQGLWQLAVTGYDHLWFAVLHGRKLRTYELARDDAAIASIVSTCREFWEEYVLTGNPPPLDGTPATLDALADMYPTATPGATVAVDDIAAEVEALKYARDAIKTAQSLERGAKAAIMATLGDAEEGTIAGQRAVSWRQQERRALDTDALRADHPDLTARYTITTTHRVMRTHEPRARQRKAPA